MSHIRAFGLFAAAVTVALVVSATPASGATTGWQVELTVPRQPTSSTNAKLVAIWTASGKDIWAVGANSGRMLIRHWDGTAWQSVAPPTMPAGVTGPKLTLVRARTATDVWVAGIANESVTRSTVKAAFVAHWDGTAWTRKVLADNTQIKQIAQFAASNVWFLGVVGSNPLSVHWTGTQFVTGGLPALPTANVPDTGSGAWAPAQTTGTNPVPVLLHYNGTSWVTARSPAVHVATGDSAHFEDVVALGGSNVWLSAGLSDSSGAPLPGTALFHWDGTSWSLSIRLPAAIPGGMTSDGASGVWLLNRAADTLLDLSGGIVVSRVAPPTFDKVVIKIAAVTRMPGTHNVWIAGAFSEPVSLTQVASIGAVARYAPPAA